MKKVLAILLSVLMLAGVLAGCGTPAPSAPTKFVVLEDKLEAEEYGIGFRNEDYALGAAVQDALDAMIADGKAAEICQKWFGKDVMLKSANAYDTLPAAISDDSLQKIKDKGELVLGLDASFPPMGFTDENNEIVGFDIDLAEEVCARLGVKLKKQPIDWDAKEMELNAGNIDCIWNGMSINDERVENMLILKPYIANAQVMIAPDNSSIRKIADMAGKKVGLQKGSSALDAVQGCEVFDQIGEIVEYADNVTCYMDLKTGRIDVMVVDEVVGRYLIETE